MINCDMLQSPVSDPLSCRQVLAVGNYARGYLYNTWVSNYGRDITNSAHFERLTTDHGEL